MGYATSLDNEQHRGRDVRMRRGFGARGFTLIEMVFSVTIVSILAAIALPRVSDQIEKGRVAKAIGDIRAVQAEVEGYSAGHSDSLPSSLAQVGRGGMQDPWGNVYVYSPFAMNGGSARTDQFGVPLNARYDLYSRGKDESSALPVTAGSSQDDVVRGADGGFIGLGSHY
jgi:prepilin-type N-terminal cleavage/methylation domain-containing protein